MSNIMHPNNAICSNCDHHIQLDWDTCQNCGVALKTQKEVPVTSATQMPVVQSSSVTPAATPANDNQKTAVLLIFGVIVLIVLRALFGGDGGSTSQGDPCDQYYYIEDRIHCLEIQSGN